MIGLHRSPDLRPDITDRNFHLALSLLFTVASLMKIQSFVQPSSYRRLLLLVPAIGSMGFAGCASVAGTAGSHPTVNVLTAAVGKHPAGDPVTLGPSAYNPGPQNFEPPWPFGPESYL